MARRMLNCVALHQMSTSPLETIFYLIPRNFYPSADSSIAVTTSDFPNQLYLLLQRNRKRIQDKQQVVEVDIKKRNIPLTLFVRGSDTKNDCVIDQQRSALVAREGRGLIMRGLYNKQNVAIMENMMKCTVR